MNIPVKIFGGLLLATILASAPAATTPVPASSRPPNVVIVLTDDQGYGDLGLHGNPWIRTPEMDRLGRESVRLNDYHASPYCVPTRASLLTGRYADRQGVHNHLNPQWFPRTEEVFVSRMFRDRGYATGMFGKWHLGDNFPHAPHHRGFEEALYHKGGAVGVLSDHWDNSYVDDTYFRNGVPEKQSGYCTDVFFSAATDFIDRSAAAGRPFLVYLATNAPHGPLVCPPEEAAPYQGAETRAVASFYGMISRVDRNLGRLRRHLEERGLAKNTILVFTTDNGTGNGEKVYNAGLRGKKASVYDGGHRTPCFIHWPGGGLGRERVVETLAAHIDLVPTLLDLCGLPAPAGVRFDGRSLGPVLRAGDAAAGPERLLLAGSHMRGAIEPWKNAVVLSEQWRLVEGRELYAIQVDPGQARDVAAEHPDVVSRLRSFHEAMWREFSPEYDRVVGIPLGDPDAPSVVLNYHDCLGRQWGWYQNEIRDPREWIDAPGSPRPAPFWLVDVMRPGTYTFEVRRWPREIDTGLTEGLPAGEPVYGRKALRSVPGAAFPAEQARFAVDGRSFDARVESGALGVVFMVDLPAGAHRVSAGLHAADGRRLDAFYVYVQGPR